MKAVKVEYTVKQEYVETNKRNIEQVMSDLSELNNPGIKYSTFQLNDGKSFLHIGIYADEAALVVVNDLDSFKSFRMQLKESQPESPPKSEDLTLVASSFKVF